MKEGWIRVSRRRHCPVCDKDHWCTISDDGQRVHCMTVPSQKPCRKGGWIHKMTETIAQPPQIKDRRPKPREVTRDFESMAVHFEDQSPPDSLRQASDLLGVSTRSLERLRCALWPAKHAHVFPMRNHLGTVCGLRLRDINPPHKKWCVRGSHEGCFIPKGFSPLVPFLIVEGPTDCAAALDLGFEAIGRPSCVGGLDIIVALCRKYRPAVTVVSDNDEWKVRPDGSRYRPGQDGARALVNEIKRHCRSISDVIPPDGIKDMRKWMQSGATMDDVLSRMRKVGG